MASRRTWCISRYLARSSATARVRVIRRRLARKSRPPINRRRMQAHTRRTGSNKGWTIRTRRAARDASRRGDPCRRSRRYDRRCATRQTHRRSGRGRGRSCYRDRRRDLSRRDSSRWPGFCFLGYSLRRGHRRFRPGGNWNNRLRVAGRDICMGRAHGRSIGRTHEPCNPCLFTSFRRESNHIESHFGGADTITQHGFP
jgi:hypothetical protein